MNEYRQQQYEIRKQAIKNMIEIECAARSTDEISNKMWHSANAMMAGYFNFALQNDDFETVGCEREFKQSIINPKTKAESKSYIIRGKIDRHAMWKGQHVLIENKTTGDQKSLSVDRLGMEFQPIIYSYYYGKQIGEPINTVIFKILLKQKLQQGKGENEEEFTERYRAACAANKSGKSSATRKYPESDEAFQARLQSWHSESPENLDATRYRHEVITIGDELHNELLEEVWMLTQQLLDARREDEYYRNDSQCFNTYGGECEFFKICSKNKRDQAHVIEEYFQIKSPFGELSAIPYTDKRQFLTYTALRTFRNCRRLYRFKYLDCLKPLEKNEKLYFGSLIHKCLEIWHAPFLDV